MTEAPFYSILLPTKNRAHLVGYAIRSVLQQNFEDFELIICDNDDDSNATRRVVEEFNDHRIKYIRTGDLDMVANWNRALDAATGQHVTVLEDKMIFYPEALLDIKSLIESSPNGIVVWKRDLINDDSDIPALIQSQPTGDEVIVSDVILRKIVSSHMSKYWEQLPRGLCCSVPKWIINQIVEKTGRPFYEATSPDFVSSVKLLAYTNEFLLSGQVFTLITSNKVSNGRRFSQRKDNSFSYFSGNKKFEVQLNGVYVKSRWIAGNLVIADYLNQQRLLGGKLNDFDVINRNYFEMLFHELLVNSLAEKKVLWQKNEVWQLFKGGDGLIRNSYYAATMVINKFISRPTRSKKQQQLLRQKVPTSISPDFIDHYLLGVVKITNRKSYS